MPAASLSGQVQYSKRRLQVCKNTVQPVQKSFTSQAAGMIRFCHEVSARQTCQQL